MPAAGSVIVVAGWAAGFGNVFLLPSFDLNAGSICHIKKSILDSNVKACKRFSFGVLPLQPASHQHRSFCQAG